MHDRENEALLVSWGLWLHDKADTTRKMYTDVLRRFGRTLPGSLLDAAPKDCRAYFAKMRDEGLARATIRSRWIAMRSFYNWAVEEEEIDASPMAGIKVERAAPPPIAFFTDDDLTKLFKTCAGRGFLERRDLAMFRLAAATGMRIAELCALDVNDIDLARCMAMVRHGKGDRARVVRFDPETGAIVDRYLRTRARQKLAGKYPTLFLSRFGPFGRKGAMHMIIRRCEQAGISHYGWHAFRHRFAHEWKARGGHDDALQQLGGWTDPGVMRRYGASLATQRAVDEYTTLGGVL